MFSNQNMKKIAFWLFITMICSFAIAGSIFMTTGGAGAITLPGSDPQNAQEVNVEKAFTADGLKDISVDTVSTDIRIIPVETNEIKVHFHGTAASGKGSNIPELEAGVTGSKLDIRLKYKPYVNFPFNFGFQKLALDVYVPGSYGENMRINTVSAGTNIENFSLSRFDFHSVSGDLNASKLGTKASVLGTTSGDVDITHFTGDLEFNSVSGGLNISYDTFNNNIKANTTSGDAKIRLPATAEFSLNFNSVSGDMNCAFPMTTNGAGRRQNHNLSGTVGSGNNKIEIHTVSGSAEILK